MTRLFLRIAVCALFVVVPILEPAQVRAETAGQAQVTAADLSRVLMIPAMIDVMRDEGLDYGASLRDEMFPERGGDTWAATVALVYDAPTMLQRFEGALATALKDDAATMTAVAAFFGTPQGQSILSLELEARRAMMDEAVDEAARARAAEMAADNDPRMKTLREFAEVNDLIEANVQGGLNANLGFYQGMAQSGAFGDDMTEDQILSDVWAQEPEVRQETESWLFAFLALAYGPLPDKDLQDYIAFSGTPEGQKMNAALFAAFDAVFVKVSRDLGRAVAHQMVGDDI